MKPAVTRRSVLWRLLALLALSPVAAAGFLGKELQAASPPDFALADPGGRLRRPADFRGRVVGVVFGYTHCPDYCPTTLARLAAAARQLEGAPFTGVFITLDPERDGPAALADYVAAFHPQFVGLRGDAEQTARAAASFRVLFEKVQESDTNYSLDHSGGILLLDPQGRLRLKAGDRMSAADIAADVRRLLDER